jgi:hypothetical protein
MPSMLLGLTGTNPQRMCVAAQRTPQFQNGWVAVAILSAGSQVAMVAPGLEDRPVLLPRVVTLREQIDEVLSEFLVASLQLFG